MLSDTAGTPTMIEGQKALISYIPFAAPDGGICERLRA